MLPLLTRDETCALAKLAQAGDIAARNELIVRSRGLVIPIALKYVDRGLDMEDLVGEGNLGLFPAVARFDPSHGTEFSTYATWWIKETIRRALVNTAPMVRLPTHTISLMSRWWQTSNTMARNTGRVPHEDDVSARMGLSNRQCGMVRKALHVSPGHRRRASDRRQTSTDLRLDDQVDPAESVESVLDDAEQSTTIARRLHILNHREQAVITMRFGLDGEEPMLQRAIGTRLGISKERVRQIVAHALQKMQRTTPLIPLAIRKTPA